MDAVLWPLMFLCLNGCYGPPQVLRGQVERLPPGTLPVGAPTPAPPPGDAELVGWARELGDAQAWASRVGRLDLPPSRVIALAAQGVPAGHLDALHARGLRAREADCGTRVAEREKQVAQVCAGNAVIPAPPPPPYGVPYPQWPVTPYPYGGPWVPSPYGGGIY